MATEIDDSYFSEREGEVVIARELEIGSNYWGGFVATVQQKIGNNSFAETFPIGCSDTGLPYDTDFRSLGRVFKAEIHNVDWPLEPDRVPSTLDALNSAEFFWRQSSKVERRIGHNSRSWGFQHHHFVSFDRQAGRDEFRNDINRLLRRCAHPYILDEQGMAKRRLPSTVQSVIRRVHFRTGDNELDRLLSEACEKFESPDLKVQKESLERLWDAWERLKSMLLPDKAASTKTLLDEFVTEPQLRQFVEKDASELTSIGNNLMIRHTEIRKPPISKTQHVDYLFFRLFALISAILKSRGWSVSI